MILVLCANAGIDRTYEVENFGVGQYHYPRHYRVAAGGKGVNVSRALRVFSAKVAITGFAGGLAAQLIHKQMLEIGAQPVFSPIAEESRLCINIVDTYTGSQTQVDEVGPLVTPSEVDDLRRRWQRLLPKAQLAVISGSVPRGVPSDLYGELVAMAHEADRPVLLDARDDLLRRALPAGPSLVKVNVPEMERLAGRPIVGRESVLAAARELVNTGVPTVVVTLGRAGSVAVGAAGEELLAEPPDVEDRGGVGCGDAFMAGLAAAMAGGRDLTAQMRWGTAAGAANAMTLGACLFDRAQVQECYGGVRVRTMAEATAAEAGPASGAASDDTQGGTIVGEGEG